MTTMEDVLRGHGVPFVDEHGGKHSRPGWLNMKCPMCGGDPYLGYSLNWSRWNCWRCGPLPFAQTLTALTNMPWQEARELSKGIEKEYRRDQRRYPGVLKLPAGIEPLRKPHLDYIRKRGFDPDYLVNVWGVQGLGPLSRLGWRLFIPITYQGETVSWTTRSLDDQAPDRYRSASPSEESVNHHDLLLGEDYCKSVVTVTEGPFDAFSIGLGATCTFGVRVSPAQLRRISRFPRRIVAFDNEPKAQRRARDLCRRLAAFPGETVNVVLTESKDPGSGTEEELNQLRGMLT